jgi:hypothetical protein
MNRLFKFAALFATIVSFTVLANEVLASTPTKSRTTGQQHKQAGTGSTTQSPSATPATNPTLVYRVPPGGWKAQGGLFNQPTKPTFPYRVPPGGWKVYGGLFGSQPTQPPMSGGHGTGFRGGFFGGGTVVTTPTTVVDPTAAPGTAASDTDAAKLMEIAAGSSFTLKGEKLGEKEGRIGMIIGSILIPVEVTRWNDNAVTVTVPPVGVGAAAKAAFVIERADGSVANQVNFELVAAK